MEYTALLAGNDEIDYSAQKPKLEIADIFRRYYKDYQDHHAVSNEQNEISYNSCRNRHCPKCQTVKKLRWIKQREAELLPVPLFSCGFYFAP